jgi:hypothetical protein
MKTTTRLATLADAGAMARIYSEAIEDRIATFETEPHREARPRPDGRGRARGHRRRMGEGPGPNQHEAHIPEWRRTRYTPPDRPEAEVRAGRRWSLSVRCPMASNRCPGAWGRFAGLAAPPGAYVIAAFEATDGTVRIVALLASREFEPRTDRRKRLAESSAGRDPSRHRAGRRGRGAPFAGMGGPGRRGIVLKARRAP